LSQIALFPDNLIRTHSGYRVALIVGRTNPG
jgi:hypothetical protein